MSRHLDFFTDLSKEEQGHILDYFHDLWEEFPDVIRELHDLGFNFTTDCYSSWMENDDFDFLQLDPPDQYSEQWHAQINVRSDYFDLAQDIDHLNDIWNWTEGLQSAIGDDDPFKAIHALLDAIIEQFPPKIAEKVKEVKNTLTHRRERLKHRYAEEKVEIEKFKKKHPDLAAEWDAVESAIRERKEERKRKAKTE